MSTVAQEQRRNRRYRMALPCQVLDATTFGAFTATTVNMSSKGMAIVCRRQERPAREPAEGHNLRLLVEIPGGEDRCFDCRGTVLRKRVLEGDFAELALSITFMRIGARPAPGSPSPARAL